MEPEVGDFILDPKGYSFRIVDGNPKAGSVRLAGGSTWYYWPYLQEKGWTLKEDKMAEQPLWPDEDFEEARGWRDSVNWDKEQTPAARGMKRVIDAEERRREPQVCGAESPFLKYGSPAPHKPGGIMHVYHPLRCTLRPHEAGTGHEAGDYRWADPPQCEKPHLTEAAERVVEYAREIAQDHTDAALDVHNDPDCPECALIRALKLYNREAKQ